MLTFSYTILPALKQEIENINSSRDKILLQQIPRREELQLRFETTIDRLTYASRMTENKLKRQDVIAAVDPLNKKNLPAGRQGKQDIENGAYSLAYEWVNQKWYLEKKEVKISDIKKIYSILGIKKNIDEKLISDALEFIQVNPEHPIVQSALSFILILNSLPTDINSIRISIIVSYIFMYKYGYDFCGMLCVEEFLSQDMDHFNGLIDQAIRERNLSSYLEYFTQAISISAENAYKKISQHELKHDIPASFYELTERQKEIMALFIKPGAKVSNKNVQKEFGISQITASRDLGKLYTLGLIFQKGKGRSIYYTRT